MNIFKKFICSFMAVSMALMINAVPSSVAAEAVSQFNDDEIMFEDVSTIVQKPGETAFGVLSEFLTKDENNRESKYLNFWDDYGGSYINEDGALCIYSTNDYTDIIKQAGINENDIQFFKTDYSYSELKQQQKTVLKIRNKLLESKDDALALVASKIISVAISQRNNSLTIFVNGFSDSDYKICEEYLKGIKYCFESTNSNGEVELQTTVKPGQAISTGGSVGFRCKYNGNKGFITTVHTNNYSSINPVKDETNTTTLGTISFSKCDDYADFCFVQTETGVETSTTTLPKSTSTLQPVTLSAIASVTYLPEGYTVYLAGKKNQYIRTGSVCYFDYSLGAGDSWCLCDYYSEAGDSGGCVFANVNGDYCVLGIHDGRITNTSYRVITKFSTMQYYYSGLQFYSS